MTPEGVNSSQPRTLNLTHLLAQVNGDPTFLVELIGIFLSELPGHLTTLKAALAHQNPGELRSAAHRLRSPLSFFRVQPAEGLAEQLEDMGRAGDLANAGQVWSELETEIERIHAELLAMRNEMTQQPS